MTRTAALCGLLAAAGCAHNGAAGPVSIETAGWAPDDPVDPEGARRRATADALRRAVERSSGLQLAARTRVIDGAAVSSQVATRSTGCVLRHEMLEERAQGGGHMARLRVLVASSAESCRGRPPLPSAALLDASVAVMVDGGDALGRTAVVAAREALRGSLATQGYRLGTDRPGLLLSATTLAVPVRDPRLAPFIGARAELLLRVVSTPDGRVLHEGRSFAAALGDDAESAAQRAASEASVAALAQAATALEIWLWERP